jgi:hypothetical protein
MIRGFSPDVAVVDERVDSSRVVEYLCSFLLSKHELPLLRACKAHSVLVERISTIRALDVMIPLLSSSEAHEMPCG